MKRFEALDSLRGIAAATVMIFHIQLARGYCTDFSQWAVMLFFVLSGFVLALPWVDGRPQRWDKFLTRRVCRLWPPMAVAVAAGAGLFLLTGPDGYPGGVSWHGPLAGGVLLQCLTLIGPDGGCPELAPPLWSLIYEARVSLVFPLLAVVTLRVPTTMLVLALVLGLPIDILVLTRGWQTGPAFSPGWLPSVVATQHYIPLFVFGILLAQRIGRSEPKRIQSVPVRIGLLAVAAVLAAAPSEMAKGAAAMLLIPLVIASPGWLSLAPLRWFGRVSYSLYLIHYPILALMLWLLGSPSPLLPAILGATLSCLAAETMYRLIEAPSIVLGRRWSSPRGCPPPREA